MEVDKPKFRHASSFLNPVTDEFGEVLHSVDSFGLSDLWAAAKLSSICGLNRACMENTEGGQHSWVRAAIIGRRPKRTLLRIVVLVVTCFVVFRFVLLPIRVDGGSMLPTYKEHGINVINRVAYLFHEPRRGDVVGIRLAGPSV